ncbi:hypothetical protein EVAR_102662_1 [Eumeta japonica]|uniref:Uncharacterized protein n=1 Tax=Eumeta variegata TaxID=151549 RepID=A0A4C1TUT8_EUMVA|nr:hypothetical protein EVAR_102662_1 [Eumeta japonica]
MDSLILCIARPSYQSQFKPGSVLNFRSDAGFALIFDSASSRVPGVAGHKPRLCPNQTKSDFKILCQSIRTDRTKDNTPNIVNKKKKTKILTWVRRGWRGTPLLRAELPPPSLYRHPDVAFRPVSDRSGGYLVETDNLFLSKTLVTHSSAFRYPLSPRKAGNALIALLKLRVSMGGGDRLLLLWLA